jgi:hypothetical protein
MKCQRCGIESPADDVFRTVPRVFGPDQRLCPGCQVGRQRSQAVVTMLVVAALAAVALSIHAAGVTSGSWLWVNLLLVCVLEFASIAAHELGHVAAARLVRLKVFRVCFGTGRKLLEVRVRGVAVEVRPWPLFGSVQAAGPPRNYERLRRFVYVLGGPAANVLLIAVALAFLPRHQNWFRLMVNEPAPWVALALANAVGLITALYPTTVKDPEGSPFATDGLQLLKLPFADQAAVDEWRTIYYVLESLRLTGAGRYEEATALLRERLARDAGRVELRLVLANALIASRGWREGRELLLGVWRELRPPESAADFVRRGVVANNIAWTDVLLGEPALLEEADHFSAEAMRLTPWSFAVMNTRGCVLVEMGRLGEGTPLIRAAMAGTEQSDSKACCACYLAVAASRGGDAPEARRLLEVARRLGPTCDVFPYAERVLAAGAAGKGEGAEGAAAAADRSAAAAADRSAAATP